MKSIQLRFAGLGGLAFGILAFVAMLVAAPPGGNYKVSDVTSFLAKGHRPAVFLSVYLMLIAVVGLALLLARLRTAIEGSRETLFWGFSLASVAAWLIGYALVVATPAALAFSGGKLSGSAVSPQTAYIFSEAGYAVMYGAGGMLLGVALIVFALGRVAVPGWVRLSVALAGICALAGIAWFPFFVVYLWAVVVGVWALLPARASAQQSAAPRVA
jgi:hypothetical protein